MTENLYETDYFIIGGGLAGISFARELEGSDYILCEATDRLGGLLKSVFVDGFWFDAVVHLLYFHNERIKQKLQPILTSDFVSLPQNADVSTNCGKTPFPFQFNLGSLPSKEAISCLTSFLQKPKPNDSNIENFKDWLVHSFGQRMCEIFFYPYNQKMWKRDLESLASREFTWTIQKASEERVTEGLLNNQSKLAYNSNSYYPVPNSSSPLRGMELLIELLASNLQGQLLTNHIVKSIDSEAKLVTVKAANQTKTYHYRKACISTAPLPTLLQMLPGKYIFNRLVSNGVVYAMVMIKGEPYPTNVLSTYFAQDHVIFNRVIYMHNFDPLSAPTGNWSLMAEVTFRTEDGCPPHKALRSKIKSDLVSLGIVKNIDDFLNIHLEVHPYAYVVFEPTTNCELVKLKSQLIEKDIHLLGRYGKWQYINITQGYEEAMDLAAQLQEK